MRIAATLFLTFFVVNLYAGKPVDPPPEPDPIVGKVFVGYSNPLPPLADGNAYQADQIWFLGTEYCYDKFGEGAQMANTEQVRAAVDNGSFFFPEVDTYGVLTIASTSTLALADSDKVYDPYLNIRVVTGSIPAALTNPNNSTMFISFNTLTSTSSRSLTYGCVQ